MHIFPELTAVPQIDTSMKQRFWQRQFLPTRTPTTPQVVFDLTFGVVAPIACFMFDPIVFQAGFGGPPLFPAYSTVVYLLSGFEIVLLCLWLLMGQGAEFSNAMLGGALILGGAFCLMIGLILLPFSAMGLLLGIGIFGFTPFVTAFVYLRNGLRALRAKADPQSRFTRATGFLCGAVLVLGVPALLAWQIQTAASRSVDEILSGDALHASHAAHRLTVLRYLAAPELDRIVAAYISETDAQRKETLRSYYRQITGEDIEVRVRIVQD